MNVINDNWLFVRYLDDTVRQISIRQAFIDAEQIKNIETPVFHGTPVKLYEVSVMQFLAVIVLAAYFKPENGFRAKAKFFNLSSEWDTDLILKYLDQWETRFELFDEKYPFLQDPSLKGQANFDNTSALSYISKVSIITPKNNNIVFEHRNNEHFDMDQYTPTVDELVYLLLYNNFMGTSSMATQYPNKTLNANATLFIVNYKDNLKESIICNALPIRESVSNGMYDRPVWELDSRSDIAKFDDSSIAKNVLLCSFFPSFPLYVAYQDNKIKDIVLARKAVIPSEKRGAIEDAYVFTNPCCVRYTGKKKDKKTKAEVSYSSYLDWHATTKLINLCVDATKKFPEGMACKLFDVEYQQVKDVKSIIYYREYTDKYKAAIASFGFYSLPQGVFEILSVDANHEKAVQFVELLTSLNNKFLILKLIPETNLNTYKKTFYSFAENCFFNELIPQIETPDIIEKTAKLFIEKIKQDMLSFTYTNTNPFKYAEEYRIFCAALTKLQKSYEGEKEIADD